MVDNLQPAAAAALVPEVRLWIAVPVDRPGQQVTVERIEPEPLETVEDRHDGNRVAVWQLRPAGAPGTPLHVTIDFVVEASAVENAIDPARIAPTDRAAGAMERHLRVEPWLERTPAIDDLASRVAPADAGPWAVVRGAFDWVRRELVYRYPDVTERGAAKALARRSGDCGDFAHLLIALCRARGVPSRAVTACWFTGSGHQWAEVWLPPYGWVPVDPSMAHAISTRAPAFGGAEGTERLIRDSGLPTADPSWLCGNLYPNRLVVSTGTNIECRPRHAGLERTFAFLQPGGGNAWPPAIELDAVGDHVVHGGFFLFDAEARDEAASEAKAVRQLAQSWLHAGDLERAEAGARLSLAEEPDSALHWFVMGQIEMARGAWPAAGDAFGRALSGRGGSMKHVIDAWARVFRGMAFDALRQRDAAIAEYERAIEAGVDYQGSLDTARGFLAAPFVP